MLKRTLKCYENEKPYGINGCKYVSIIYNYVPSVYLLLRFVCLIILILTRSPSQIHRLSLPGINKYILLAMKTLEIFILNIIFIPKYFVLKEIDFASETTKSMYAHHMPPQNTFPYHRSAIITFPN